MQWKVVATVGGWELGVDARGTLVLFRMRVYSIWKEGLCLRLETVV